MLSPLETGLGIRGSGSYADSQGWLTLLRPELT
jgi:hypothetical protein